VLPREAVGAGGNVVIELRMDAPRSPKALGVSGDARELGIALRRLILPR
jgi:hypothetical protein